VCHTHSGDGAKIGPDLTGVAAHTKEHLLIDILDPSRSVEGNFRVYTVETKKGLTLSGLLASGPRPHRAVQHRGQKAGRRTRRHRTAHRVHEIADADGFEKTLKQDELIDLWSS